jgi:hypothetical protein
VVALSAIPRLISAAALTTLGASALNASSCGDLVDAASAMLPSTSPSRLNSGAARPAMPERYSPSEKL